MARWDLHRGFVGLHGEQRLLGLDGVAGFDQQFYDGDFSEVTNVRNLDIYQCHDLCLLESVSVRVNQA